MKCYIRGIPKKIRDLIRDLRKAGFADRGCKGNHRNFVHPNVIKPITISGNKNDDAKRYQERAVGLAIKEALI
jgi:predicted RNA binding protein YcfA (HicA-like mRNA interferase family)